MKQITHILLATKSELSAHLGVSRRTLYYWKTEPEVARKHLPAIRAYIAALLAMIDKEMAAPADAVKSDWDLRMLFEQLRHESQSGNISLTPEQQEEICRLVERFYR